MMFKSQNIRPSILIALEFIPAQKQIIQRNNFIKIMGNNSFQAQSVSVPLIHKITDFYKNIYLINKQINKRDRLGIGQKIENTGMDALAMIIEAAYLPKQEKSPVLKNVRIKIEILKQIVRAAKDIHAISDNTYIRLEAQLVAISIMNNNWLNWAMEKESPK